MSFAGTKINLLAGTMLAAVFIPQPGEALSPVVFPSVESAITLAQAPDAIDPQTGRPLPKGAQPKGPAPKGPQAGSPPSGQPQGAQPKQLGQPPQGGQPKQFGQPPQGGLPKQVGQPPQDGQPKQLGQPPQGAQPKQLGQPPQGAQPKQFGQPPQGGQPKQFGQPSQGGLPKQVGQPPQDAQPKQLGQPPQGAQPKQLGQPPQGGLPKQVGQPPQGGQPKQLGQPPLGAPPEPLGQPAQPKQLGQPPQGGLPKQVGQPPQPGSPPGTPGQAGAPAAGSPQQFGRGPDGRPGNVDQLRTQRTERTEAGGRMVIEEPGGRFIVREGGRTFIRYDDTQRFHRWGAPRIEQRGGEQFAYIVRPGGYQIINVTDSHGRLIRRVRRGPDGREIVLVDNRRGPGFGVGVGVGLAAGVILGLAAPVIAIPRERYIVNVSAAPAPLIYETLEAPPLVAIERPYSLDEIRYNVALRDRMRRVDIDSITFESGSWEVTPEQQQRLAAVADAIQRVLANNPNEMLLVEGHTDAVGADVDNLSLSDRRAESVAVILTDVYQVPPENLVTQGYGEQHLKTPTEGPARENRRVTVRRITPLLHGGVASR